MSRKAFRSEAFASIHATASALHRVGVVDKTTMRAFDAACLTVPVAIEPAQIKRIRESNHVRAKNESWIAFIRHAKAPELPVVLLEDIAALTGLVFALFGVGMSALTHNPVFDAIGAALLEPMGYPLFFCVG